METQLVKHISLFLLRWEFDSASVERMKKKNRNRDVDGKFINLELHQTSEEIAMISPLS